MRKLGDYRIEVGNHSMTHSHFRTLSRDELEIEIGQSRRELQGLSGHRCVVSVSLMVISAMLLKASWPLPMQAVMMRSFSCMREAIVFGAAIIPIIV